MGNCWSELQHDKKNDIDLAEFNRLQNLNNWLRSELQSSKKQMEMLKWQANKRKPDLFQQQNNSFRHQQLAKNTSETNRLLLDIEEQKKISLSYKQAMDQLQKDNNNMASQLRKNQQLISSLEAKNKQLTQKNLLLKKENESLKAKVDANRNSQNSESVSGQLVHRAKQFFSGDVLDLFDDFKIYLLDILKKEMGLTIKRTQPSSFMRQQMLKKENNRLISIIKERNNRIISCQQTIEQLKRDKDISNHKNTQIISSLQVIKKQLTQEILQLKKQIESLNRKVEANQNSQNSESVSGHLVHRATKFFSGDVLDQFDDYKIYLTSILEKEMGLTIKRTQLLFRYEKAFPRNLHLPVDGHSPIVLVLKTVKGYHIACVSEVPFAPKSSKEGRGWLISLTKGRVYRSVVGKQAILYDEMDLIFGNQQLRIDGASNKVFSNFGISNSFYNHAGNEVRDFLGPALDGTPREVEIESYEIFKLITE